MADGERQHRWVLTLLLGAAISTSTAPASGLGQPSRSPDDTGTLAQPGESSELFAGDLHLERHSLLEAVEARNPSLKAARAALEAEQARPEQARSLADPRLSYSFAPQSIASDAVRYGQTLGYSQNLPFSGTRRLRRELSEAEAAVAAEDVETTRLRLRTAASLAYDDYYVVHRAIEINEEHIELLAMFQRIATARYAAGETPQQAPLQAEVEAAHLQHRRVVLETERALTRTEINRLLHRRPDAYLPPAPPALDEVADEADESDPESQALATRPELRSARESLRARQAEVELADLDSKPRFEVMGSYNTMWNASQHRLMVGGSIRLPLFSKRSDAAVAEAEAAARSQADVIDDLVDRVRAEVATAQLRLEEAQHVVALYRSRLLPATDDQVSAALSGFRTGQSSFPALIDAERMQRSVKLEYEQALADVHRRRAELDLALGRAPGQGGER